MIFLLLEKMPAILEFGILEPRNNFPFFVKPNIKP
jgi:hypothetical protein